MSSSDHYYFIKTINKKQYYETRTNKPIAIKNIPKDVPISNIKERSRDENINLQKKNKYDLLIKRADKLRTELEKVEKTIRELKEEVNFEQANETKQKSETAEKEYQKMKKNYGSWYNFFDNAYEKRYEYSSERPIYDVLTKYNILTKRDWKMWLVKNHPDKGGNEEICKSVIVAGRAKGW